MVGETPVFGTPEFVGTTVNVAKAKIGELARQYCCHLAEALRLESDLQFARSREDAAFLALLSQYHRAELDFLFGACESRVNRALFPLLADDVASVSLAFRKVSVRFASVKLSLEFKTELTWARQTAFYRKLGTCWLLSTSDCSSVYFWDMCTGSITSRLGPYPATVVPELASWLECRPLVKNFVKLGLSRFDDNVEVAQRQLFAKNLGAVSLSSGVAETDSVGFALVVTRNQTASLHRFRLPTLVATGYWTVALREIVDLLGARLFRNSKVQVTQFYVWPDRCRLLLHVTQHKLLYSAVVDTTLQSPQHRVIHAWSAQRIMLLDKGRIVRSPAHALPDWVSL